MDYKEKARRRAGEIRVPPTPGQQEYLQILFNDCGFSREQRNAMLTADCQREIRHLSDLSFNEAQDKIDELKELKKSKQARAG